MGTVVQRGKSYRAMVRMAGHQAEYKTFPTAAEAKRWVKERERELEEQTPTNPKVLISELIELYIRDVVPLRRMTDDHVKHDLRSLKNHFKGVRLIDLRGKGLSDWVMKHAGRISPRSINIYVSRLYGVLRQIEHREDAGIPWKDMDRCRKKLLQLGYLAPSGVRNRRVSDAELTQIKEQIMKPFVRTPYNDIIDFCVASAMRIGEVCRIRWGDLDRERRMVLIRDRKHPTRKFDNDQWVPLLGDCMAIIERQQVRKKDPERIFPFRPHDISLRFRAAADRVGLTDVVLHDLRHEGISRLFEMGFQIQEVALVSGHTNWKTLQRYTHLRPDDLLAKERMLRERLTA